MIFLKDIHVNNYEKCKVIKVNLAIEEVQLENCSKHLNGWEKGGIAQTLGAIL
jgi:hypothetical protein